MDLAAFLSDVLASKFEEMAVLKASGRGTVTMIRHKESRKKHILRRFEGSADVYKALIPVSNPHLPRVYEAVQMGAETVALTEYILGDSMSEILKGGALPEQFGISRAETRQGDCPPVFEDKESVPLFRWCYFFLTVIFTVVLTPFCA